MNFHSAQLTRPAGRNLNGRTVRLSIRERLSDLRAALSERGLGVPESPRNPGFPNVEYLASLIQSPATSFAMARGRPSAARAALNELCRDIGYSSTPVVKASIASRPLRIRIRKPDEIMEKLIVWANTLRKSAQPVPFNGAAPYFSLISELIDVDPGKLANSTNPYRHFLIELASEVGASDQQVERFQRKRQKEVKRGSERVQLLRDYLAETYLKADTPLPESTRIMGRPPYRAICSAAGLTWASAKRDPELTAAIDHACLLVGVGHDRFRQQAGSALPTYAELLDLGAQWLAIESPSNSGQVGARPAWALRRLLREWNLSELDSIDPHFVARCKADAPAIAKRIDNLDTRRHWVREIVRWQGYVDRLVSDQSGELPSDLGGALQALLRASAFKNLTDLARSVGVFDHYHAIRGWLERDRIPVATDRIVIQKLELALGVAEGTLTSRIRRIVRPTRDYILSDLWPPSLDSLILRAAARPLLPHNFARMSEAEREKIGLQIRREWEGRNAYRSKLRKTGAWRLNPLPSGLETEINALIAHKTSPVPEHPRRKPWKEGTVNRSVAVLRELFSALALPLDDGGLGIHPEHLCLAHLVCPNVIRWYGQWLAKRYPEGLNIGARVNLSLLASLTARGKVVAGTEVRPVKGYLHYLPKLAARLTPLDGVITEAEREDLLTGEGWSSAIDRANSGIWQILLSQNERFVPTRDPFEPILPILELSRPLDALYKMLELAFQDLPDPNTAPLVTRAIAVRNFVLALIAVRTALRRKNLGELTYRADNRGKLKFVDGLWRIEIPAKEFKNENGAFFGARKSKYVCVLEPQDTKIIDEYVKTCRDAFEAKGDWLFVSDKGGKRDQDLLSTTDFQDLTWKYLVYHEMTGTGIKGVERFSLHAVRDITATHILKLTGDASLAADALQDTSETILDHYAHYLPDDRTQRVRRFFATDLPSAEWDRRSV